MFCLLWVIFQTFALVVKGGVSSGSAEALVNGRVNNNGGAGAAGNNGNAGAQNAVPLNGNPILGRLVQLGGSLFIQPIGNPINQAPLQQLIPVTALQQGGAFLVGQTGGANVNPQGPIAQQAGGTLFAVLPQRNAGGNPQTAVLTPGQVQLIPGLVGGGNPPGIVRFQRSVAARLRRTQPPVMKVPNAEEEDEECSGMEPEDMPAALKNMPS